MGLTESEPRGKQLKAEQRERMLEALKQLEESHALMLTAVADLGAATRELGAAARRLEAFLRGAQPWRLPSDSPEALALKEGQ